MGRPAEPDRPDSERENLQIRLGPRAALPAGESIHVLRYTQSQRYDAHTDYCAVASGQPGGKEACRWAGWCEEGEQPQIAGQALRCNAVRTMRPVNKCFAQTATAVLQAGSCWLLRGSGSLARMVVCVGW